MSAVVNISSVTSVTAGPCKIDECFVRPRHGGKAEQTRCGGHACDSHLHPQGHVLSRMAYTQISCAKGACRCCLKCGGERASLGRPQSLVREARGRPRDAPQAMVSRREPYQNTLALQLSSSSSLPATLNFLRPPAVRRCRATLLACAPTFCCIFSNSFSGSSASASANDKFRRRPNK